MAVTSVELTLINIFKDYFAIDTVNVDWNFFDFGINSIELAKIAAALATALNREINILLFYEFPTIAMLAAALEHVAQEPAGAN